MDWRIIIYIIGFVIVFIHAEDKKKAPEVRLKFPPEYQLGRSSSCIIKQRSLRFDHEEESGRQYDGDGSYYSPEDDDEDEYIRPDTVEEVDDDEEVGPRPPGLPFMPQFPISLSSLFGLSPFAGPGAGVPPANLAADADEDSEEILTDQEAALFGGGGCGHHRHCGPPPKPVYHVHKRKPVYSVHPARRKPFGNINCIILTKEKRPQKKKKGEAEPLSLFGLPFFRRRRMLARAMKTLKTEGYKSVN